MPTDRRALLNQDFNIYMTGIRGVLENWGSGDWQEYLVVRRRDKPESFIVLNHPSDKSDFADQLIRLHRDDASGDYEQVEIPGMDAELLREFTAAMRAADEHFEKLGGGTRH
jgi:hypothetical protein